MASQIKSAGLGQSIDFAEGNVHWSYPIRIYVSDNSLANVRLAGYDDISEYLRATTFGFTIPGGATIDGIKVEIEKRASAVGMRDFLVKIVKAGSESGTNKASVVVWPTSDAYITYGGSTDKWGLTWTPANINASNFGVSLSCLYDAGEGYFWAYVDHVRITVYYTEAAGTNMKVNIGDVFKDVDEIKINIGDSWKTVVKIQINIGDVWKTVFG